MYATRAAVTPWHLYPADGPLAAGSARGFYNELHVDHDAAAGTLSGTAWPLCRHGDEPRPCCAVSGALCRTAAQLRNAR
eukprot:gene50140-57359_t